MTTLSDFDEIYKFFDRYRVNRIADLNKEIFGFKTKTEYLKEEMRAYVSSFLDVMERLLGDVERYSQNKGPIVLEWLDLIDQLLNATEGIIKTGLKSIQDDDPDIAWALQFSVYSLLTMMKLTKKELRRKRGVLKKRYSLAFEVRESTLLLLANMFYYFIKILVTSMKVKKRREIPERILEVAGEALYRSRTI